MGDRAGTVPEARRPVADDRRDRAGARDRAVRVQPDAPELVVPLIDDQERAVARERETGRLVQLCGARRTAVAERAGGSGSRDGRDDAARVDLADLVVAEVGDV